VMREILFEPMAPASTRAEQRGVAGRLPPGFDAWFERCVAREPKARFTTATELLESFEQVCSGFESEAMGPPASIPGALAGDSTTPLSTRSYLAREGAAGASSTGDGDTGPRAASEPARAAKPLREEKAVAAASANLSSSDWEHKTELAPSGPTASAFAAASPTVPGDVKRDDEAGPRPRSVQRNMVLGIGIGLLAAVGALFVTRGLSSQGPPTSSTTTVETTPSASVSVAPPIVSERRPEPEAIPSASASAIPSASAISVPSARPSAERAIAPIHKPTASATTASGSRDGGVAEPAPEKKKPFNFSAAMQSVENRKMVSRMACATMPGPKVISGIVYFSPVTGSAMRIDGDMSTLNSQTGACVRGSLLACHVEPFDGESQGVPFAVDLQ